MRHCICLVLLFLSACHQRNIKVFDYSEVTPITKSHWSIKGKMAFNDGQEGGSGSVFWEEIDGFVNAEFKAPLGQGSWNLNEQEGWIKNNKGQQWWGPNMSELLSQQLGWMVPWEALKKSIKGVKPEGVVGDVFVAEGWQIKWTKIKSSNGHLLPHKIEMKKPPYSVKVIVKIWNWE